METTNQPPSVRASVSDLDQGAGNTGPPFSPTRRYFQGLQRKGKPQKVAEECPICRESAVLVQDHCHVSGLCRDRICASCNNLLGRIENKPARLEALLAYAERWKWEHAHGGVRYSVNGKHGR